MQLELFALDRLVQAGHHLDAAAADLLQRVQIPADVIAAARLDLAGGPVGTRQQDARRVRIAGKRRKARRRRQKTLDPGDLANPAQRLHHRLGQGLGRRRVADAMHHQRELVARQPRQPCGRRAEHIAVRTIHGLAIGGARRELLGDRRDPPADFADEFVASRLPEGFVELRDPIEIEHGHVNRLRPRSRGVDNSVRQRRNSLHWAARQRIGWQAFHF
jgi:hypothetical protein